MAREGSGSTNAMCRLFYKFVCLFVYKVYCLRDSRRCNDTLCLNEIVFSGIISYNDRMCMDASYLVGY